MTAIVAPCSHDAAKHAVTRWHYSEQMPAGKTIKFGVWENSEFVGAIVYGRGANKTLGQPYGLGQLEACELVRIALRDHDTPVTQLVAESLRQLRLIAPGLRLVISFADPEQGHHGGIYQAGNWIYTGMTPSVAEYLVNGRRVHGRSARAMRSAKGRGAHANTINWLRANVDPNAREIPGSTKHRYLMPLDRQTRRRVRKLAMPYPAREGSTVSRSTSNREVLVQPRPRAPIGSTG